MPPIITSGPGTEHCNISLTHTIKGESNQEAHTELGSLYRDLAITSGVARASTLAKGANVLRKRYKLGVLAEDPDPTCFTKIGRHTRILSPKITEYLIHLRFPPRYSPPHRLSPSINTTRFAPLHSFTPYCTLSHTAYIALVCSRAHFRRPLTSVLWLQTFRRTLQSPTPDVSELFDVVIALG
ncbi:pyridoxine/pyridoxamine 5'-phosphate oxidase 1, chloroplastic-like [Dorcoceras hygrometricum]|uniref:Pyridoxine/pyridoxamine 5'-phosphate oxidase 1, chloroplastic-like n=1 Tax=Dorcoceras hygrometricum TaxID=472368 RepID=A0A2Z6ZTI6_9LAMI|nr:pyridoxine/pyridoxamine 5'-phosphate oxidase 1, chloroplastic-like [Dorcoceras hygrometricum]